MTQHYIGSKQVTAWAEEKDGAPGYAVKYEDGHTSWSPKEVFEAAYLPMGKENDGSTVTQDMVDDFIGEYKVETIHGKVTLVTATLANGWVLVESSGAVTVEKYSEEIGAEECKKKIQDKTWELLGFLLQSSRYGIKAN